MDLDLLVFGDTALDNFHEVEKLPKKDEAADVVSSRRFYGGMGANCAIAAKKLGLNVGLVSVIGTDAEDYRTYMEKQGIKLYLKGIFGETTKSMFFKAGDTQISFFHKGVTEQLDGLNPLQEFGKTLPKNVNTVYNARTYLRMQHISCKHYSNSLKIYNPGYGTFKFDKTPNMFKSIVSLTDVLMLNHHEAKHLESIGYKPKLKTDQTYIVTRGKDGARVYLKGSVVDVPAYETKVVDAAGAGDAFNAGFITARIKDYDILDSVKIGNATASYVVEDWGCQTNLPTWDKVMDRYNKIK
ncbi:MAG: hypothetical protein KKD39_01385 [Candidatus Altiarchaeota archaeon]|nr:hypothetical protein [Candidatus Altiarchaeota archaeon]